MAKKGGKLNRTEVFNVRFDPILKWAAELAAARERRTLSSYIEWVVQRAVDEPITGKDGRAFSARQIADQCWHPDPIWRLSILADKYPEIMTFEERNRWQAVLFMVSVEQNIAPKQPVGGYLVDVDWLPAMHQVWPFIVESSADIDMVEVRSRYLKARAFLKAQEAMQP